MTVLFLRAGGEEIGLCKSLAFTTKYILRIYFYISVKTTKRGTVTHTNSNDEIKVIETKNNITTY